MSSLNNKSFGKWNVIKECENDRKRVVCKCECGTEKSVLKNNLLRGKTVSCGCHRKKFLSDLKTNGKRDNPKLYNIWSAMKRRCYNKNTKDYSNYGGRGITVCDEWLNDFPSFLSWSLSNGYKEGLSIDRINNNEMYSPDNCRWVTRTVQNNNKRDTRLITINETTRTLSEWSEISGVKRKTIQSRLKYGWSEKELLMSTSWKRREDR